MRPEEAAGHRARRRFGQNFLVSVEIARRIVDALAPGPGEAVLEIGPGRGALTEHLIAAAGRVAAVEIDRDLADRLARRFGSSLALFRDDILRFDFARVAAALGAWEEAPLAVAGNLPYNVSKPVAMKLVRERARIARAVLMFQREVASRLTAGPGGRDYGPLTVLAGAAFRIERLFDLPPAAFRPRPAVVSTLTRWTPVEAPPDDASLERLRACLAACFARRRRTVLNNLRAALPGGEDDARRRLAAAGIDGGARPEALPPRAYRALAADWP